MNVLEALTFTKTEINKLGQKQDTASLKHHGNGEAEGNMKSGNKASTCHICGLSSTLKMNCPQKMNNPSEKKLMNQDLCGRPKLNKMVKVKQKQLMENNGIGVHIVVVGIHCMAHPNTRIQNTLNQSHSQQHPMPKQQCLPSYIVVPLLCSWTSNGYWGRFS